MWWSFLLIYYATLSSLDAASSANSPILCMAFSQKPVSNFQNHVYTWISIHKQPCPHSPQYWVPPPQSLPGQLLLTVNEKRSGDFRESAGSGLRKRKMCMIGQASMKQTLRWRLGCSIFMGEWGKQDWAAATEASANPAVGLWCWTGLAELSLAGVKGPSFYTVVCWWLTRLPQEIGVWPWLRQLSLV